jgi:outer membrane protein assembly factor BamD
MRPHAIQRFVGSLLFFFLALTFMGGCKKAPVQISPEIASSDEALFKLGEAEVKKDQEKALLYLRQVIDSFPRSFYAQRAKLLIADTYFKKGDEGNMILAAAEYRQFIKAYPVSPSAAYCQYQIAMTFYKRIPKPGRDQSKTVQALAELKQTVTDYPLSDQAKAAQDKIKECEERLAAHAAAIGIQYAKAMAYKASISRLTEVMTRYPNYSRLDQVYFYLGESAFNIRQLDQAIPYYTKVVSDYAKSSLLKKAVKRLKEIEVLKKAKPAPVKKAK